MGYVSLSAGQTKLYWAMLDSIWFRNKQYEPYMTRYSTIQACVILDPEISVYDAVVVAEALYNAVFIKGEKK